MSETPGRKGGFPHASSQLVDPKTGRLTRVGVLFLDLLWNRTGGPYDLLFDEAALSRTNEDRINRLQDASDQFEGQFEQFAALSVEERLAALEAALQAISVGDDGDSRVEDLRAQLGELQERVDLLANNARVLDIDRIEELLRQIIERVEAQGDEISAVAENASPNAIATDIKAAPKGYGFGTLATRDNVGQPQIGPGYQLIEESSGAPTASGIRAVLDTVGGGLYTDDGSSVYRLDPLRRTGITGSDTDFSGTSYEVVAEVDLGVCSEFTLVWGSNSAEAFQTPDNASDATYEGQWAIYLSNTSQTIGNAVTAGGATLKLLWEGETVAGGGGLSFQTISNIIVDQNDMSGFLQIPVYPIGPTLDGVTVYAQLCLRRTGGSGAAKISAVNSITMNRVIV